MRVGCGGGVVPRRNAIHNIPRAMMVWCEGKKGIVDFVKKLYVCVAFSLDASIEKRCSDLLAAPGFV